jgi:hypothetical protein
MRPGRRLVRKLVREEIEHMRREPTKAGVRAGEHTYRIVKALSELGHDRRAGGE